MCSQYPEPKHCASILAAAGSLTQQQTCKSTSTPLLPADSVSPAWHPTAAVEHQVLPFQTRVHHAECETTNYTESDTIRL